MPWTCDALKMLERNALSGVLLLRNLVMQYQHPLRRELNARLMRSLRRILALAVKDATSGPCTLEERDQRATVAEIFSAASRL
jgi:hypothetical protein